MLDIMDDESVVLINRSKGSAYANRLTRIAGPIEY